MNRVTSNKFVESVLRSRLVQEETFRIMIVGEAGLGKSTLVSCLLQVNEYSAVLEVFDGRGWKVAAELPGGDSTQELRRYRYVFSDTVNDVEVKTFFEIVDTPGFASQINSHNSWLSKLEFLEQGLKRYHECERHDPSDPRVHLCLYVLPPQPRPLKELDKRVMVEVQRCVPVLPVIAKADTFDAETLAEFQAKLNDEFTAHGIAALTGLKDFPQHEYRTPLAIIASNKAYRQSDSAVGGWERCVVGEDGATLGRLYRWGLASCEDSGSSDLPHLRGIILNNRVFIMQRCDEVYQHWKCTRAAFIQQVAIGLSQYEIWETVHAVWSDKPWCCRGPEPMLGEVKCSARRDHVMTAEEVWEAEFAAAFHAQSQLEDESRWHARVCSDSTGDSREWLAKVYKECYERRARRMAQNPHLLDKFDGLMGLLGASLKNGALNRLVVGLVDAFVHEATGLPRGVVRETARVFCRNAGSGQR